MQPVEYTKPPALALLTYKVDPRPYGVSLVIQASLVAIFSVMLAVQVPEVRKVVTDHYLVMPLTPYVPDKLQVTKIRTVKVALPEPPVVAKLVVPREISKRPVFDDVKDVPAPKVEATKFDVKVPTVRTPEKPKVVLVGGFEGSNAKPTLKESPKNVQTGGFGDPNGIAGKSDRDAKLVAAHLGQFELPGGPGIGNGQGGARGVQGTVASAGFGNGIATSKPGGSNRGGVRTGGFGDAATGSTGGGNARRADAQATTPVEILAKPNPVYTDEARRKRIEGEVLLEVDFGANGQLQVRRVVRGLGYGLDDAAVHAAERIRYKPAQQDGKPTDTIATLHILFQLAE